MSLQEAAQQALEYLEAPSAKLWPAGTLHNITNALRAALAQPTSGEPVAYWISKAEQFSIAKQGERPFAKAWQPLYAAPQPAPARVPLTEDPWHKLYLRAINEAGGLTNYVAREERHVQRTAERRLAAIEAEASALAAAHGIKEQTDGQS